jgi:hypothetical protein
LGTDVDALRLNIIVEDLKIPALRPQGTEHGGVIDESPGDQVNDFSDPFEHAVWQAATGASLLMVVSTTAIYARLNLDPVR